MPIYEYECQQCGEKFEKRRRMADSDSELKCPRCGATSPKRIFSTFGTTTSSGGCTTYPAGGST